LAAEPAGLSGTLKIARPASFCSLSLPAGITPE
jgi:hypothetical protein